MSDPIHAVLKFADHWRYTALALVLTAGMLTLTACNPFEGRFLSSITGTKSTADEIYAAGSAKVAEMDERLAALRSQHDQLLITRNAVATVTNQDMAEAIRIGEENWEGVRAVINEVQNNPLVAGILLSTGFGGIFTSIGSWGDKKRTNAVAAQQSRQIKVLEAKIGGAA